ncbi:hypothetical protein VNO80_30414 [Phaseolus coccineus]|uniref:Uncharacterized protein n=1 Tax=Phaseolus coccineus TaxID=3886 RepID=A0AAN9LHT1_PHACN
MSSTSGTKGPFEIGRRPRKRMLRAPMRNVDSENEEGVVDSEIVPSSLAVLAPILRAALEIEEENPRVAYLCEYFFIGVVFEEMVKNVEFATVLYEVLKTMVAPPNIEERTRRYAEDVEHKRGQYEHYNILPLYAVGVKPAIMELPEIKAAILAISKVDNLPMPIIRATPHASNDDYTTPTNRLKKVNDILDWIASVFGFQVCLFLAEA